MMHNQPISRILRNSSRALEAYRAGGLSEVFHAIVRKRKRAQGHWPGRILEIRMDVSGACNLRCDMCYRTIAPRAPAHGGNMPLGTLRKIAARAFPYAHTVFLSCAGEPFLSPHWEDGLRLARLWGVQNVCLITNGVSVSGEIARKLVGGGLTHVTFSIDGITPATYESIRIGARFEEVLENLRRLLQIRNEMKSRTPEVICTMVLRTRNVSEAPGFVDWMADLGVDALVMQYMNVDNPELRDECLYYHPEAANAAIAEARERARIRGIPLHTPPEFGQQSAPPTEGKRPPCEHLWNSVVIAYSGKVYPCWRMQMEPFGDLDRQGFEEIWFGKKYRELREKHEGRGALDETCILCSPLMTGSIREERSFYHPSLDPEKSSDEK